MIRSNLARSRATAMSCQSSGVVHSYPLPVRGPDQPSRPNPAWGLNAQNHIKCIFVMAALALPTVPVLRLRGTGNEDGVVTNVQDLYPNMGRVTHTGRLRRCNAALPRMVTVALRARGPGVSGRCG